MKKTEKQPDASQGSAEKQLNDALAKIAHLEKVIADLQAPLRREETDQNNNSQNDPFFASSIARRLTYRGVGITVIARDIHGEANLGIVLSGKATNSASLVAEIVDALATSDPSIPSRKDLPQTKLFTGLENELYLAVFLLSTCDRYEGKEFKQAREPLFDSLISPRVGDRRLELDLSPDQVKNRFTKYITTALGNWLERQSQSATHVKDLKTLEDKLRV